MQTYKKIEIEKLSALHASIESKNTGYGKAFKVTRQSKSNYTNNNLFHFGYTIFCVGLDI